MDEVLIIRLANMKSFESLRQQEQTNKNTWSAISIIPHAV